MTTLLKAAQQALEALYEETAWFGPTPKGAAAIAALRAALAQQADTTDPGHDVDVLREHVRHLERRIRELHAQQAEPAKTFLITGNEFCGAPPAPYATWGDALAGMLDAGKIEGLRISALAQQAYTDDLNQRIKLYVGSRCAPPQQAEPQTTHSAECWRWHHKCAVAKIERECKHD